MGAKKGKKVPPQTAAQKTVATAQAIAAAAPDAESVDLVEAVQLPPSEQLSAAPQEPRLRDYLRAIVVMGWASIKRNKKTWLIAAVVLLVLLGGLKIINLRRQNTDVNEDALIIRVSRELNISGDGNPAILTVVDDNKTSQPFLQDAKNGDRVLLYYKAHKAVLFRPGNNKIIKSGSYTPPAAKLQLRQGTANTARLDDVAALLKTVPNTTIITRDASAKTDYSQTLVVNVTDRYEAEAAAVAKALGAQQRTIPQSESVPDADILIIVGAK